jgi:hypothetical protein
MMPSSPSSALWSTPGGGFDGGGPSLKEKEQEEKRREYEMALGRAADTLRTDYPKILSHCPRLDIFDDDIELVDPSGVKLHGMQNYKRTFGILRAVIKFFYNEHQSEVSSRMMFDYATKAIRVTWHATLVPKVIYGGPARTVYLDGISVYEMNRKTCLIHQHRLERACMNNQPLRYPQGIWSALNTEVVERHGIPVGSGYCSDTLPSPSSAEKSSTSILAPAVSSSGDFAVSDSSTKDGNLWRYGDALKRGSGRHLLHGQGAARRILAASGPRRSTRLQMSSSSSLGSGAQSSSGNNSSSKESQEVAAPMAASSDQASSASTVEAIEAVTVITEAEAALERALELKNRSRMKFGLMPMPMDEFLIQRQQVQVLERQQEIKLHNEKQKRIVAAEAALVAEEKKQKSKNPFDAFLSAVIPDRCESNEDCDSPLLCCDFVFKKICCASGTPVGHYNSLERHLAYIPVPAQPDPELPQNF